MPPRRNPYHDPAIREGLNNLAGMFAPPSGTDLAGYATARARQEEAARLSEIYNYAKDPNFNRELAERKAIAAGRYNPNQSFYSVDQGNAVTRRGQDLDSSTKLRQTQLQQTGETGRALLAPVARDATRFVPPEIAEMYRLPQTQTGVVAAAPGERNYLPDGRVLEGAPKPRTMDEAKASVFDQMPPEQRNAIVFGSTPLQQVIMGGTPTNVTAPNAIGQTPVPPAGQTPKAFVAQLPDGRQVPAVQRPDGSFAHAQTGERLSDDLKPFHVPTPTGKNEDVGLGTTANKTAAGTIRGAVANADRLMAEIDETIRKNPASAGIAANVLSFTQDLGQVFREFGEKFSNPNTPVSFGDLQAIANRVSPGNYNPVYRRVRAQLLELAYANARLDNPRGEVPVKSLERQIDALGLGTVGNDQAVLAVLDASRGRLRRSLAEADVLDGTAPAPTADTLYTPKPGTPAAPAAGRARIISEEAIR